MKSKIHYRRYLNFGTPIIEVPPKTVIRKSSKLPIFFWAGILIFGIGGFTFYQSQIQGENVNLVGLALQSSIIFGFFIRSLFLYFFPILSLDSKGIKLSGKKKITWKNIDNLILNAVGENEILLQIIMKDGRKLLERFNKNDQSKRYWKQIFKSYLKKFG